MEFKRFGGSFRSNDQGDIRYSLVALLVLFASLIVSIVADDAGYVGLGCIMFFVLIFFAQLSRKGATSGIVDERRNELLKLAMDYYLQSSFVLSLETYEKAKVHGALPRAHNAIYKTLKRNVKNA